MATIGGIDLSFTGQTPAGEPPYARVPAPQVLFDRRARRFGALSEGSDIAAYLLFLAELSAAQHRAVEATPLPPLPDGAARALAHTMPPLTPALAGEAGAAAVLDAMLADLGRAALADGPAAIAAKLAAMAPDGRRGMLRDVADGVFAVERLGESAIVAAALQVWFALHAAQVDEARLRNVGERLCPCCGGPPSSSTIVGWANAQGNRYLTCALCCTMWNHLRVKCTACGGEDKVSYRSVEGSTGDIAAEACDACGCYIKHLVQTKNGVLDPVADDVASLGLDIMLGAEGWRRGGVNPFLILGS